MLTNEEGCEWGSAYKNFWKKHLKGWNNKTR